MSEVYIVFFYKRIYQKQVKETKTIFFSRIVYKVLQHAHWETPHWERDRKPPASQRFCLDLAQCASERELSICWNEWSMDVLGDIATNTR